MSHHKEEDDIGLSMYRQISHTNSGNKITLPNSIFSQVNVCMSRLTNTQHVKMDNNSTEQNKPINDQAQNQSI